MRNAWYPRQQAEYVSTLRDLNPKEIVAERDFTFMMQDPKKREAPAAPTSPSTDTQATPKAKTRLLTVNPPPPLIPPATSNIAIHLLT